MIKSLWPAFLLSLLATIFCPAIVPAIRLTFFAPFLILTYYRLPAISSLWTACLCGILIDTLSTTPFGFHALTYTLTTILLYNRKMQFFEESFSTLPLMTYFFSVIATSLQIILLGFFQHAFPLSFSSIFRDTFVMGGIDSLYAMIAFSLPIIYFSRAPRRRETPMLKRPK